jgi:hypothetical protein
MLNPSLSTLALTAMYINRDCGLNFSQAPLRIICWSIQKNERGNRRLIKLSPRRQVYTHIPEEAIGVTLQTSLVRLISLEDQRVARYQVDVANQLCSIACEIALGPDCELRSLDGSP